MWAHINLSQTCLKADKLSSHLILFLNVSSLKHEVLLFLKTIPHFNMHVVWEMGEKIFLESSSIIIISPLLMKPFSNLFIPGSIKDYTLLHFVVLALKFLLI